MKKKARQQLSCWRATAETEGFVPFAETLISS